MRPREFAAGLAPLIQRLLLGKLGVAIPPIVVLAGIGLVIAVGQVSESEWSTYPIQEFEATPVDPIEPLRGAYVDLLIDDPSKPDGRTTVRFLAPEDEARQIEAALRDGPVKVEVRRAPDGRMRAVAVVTADGRRFDTR
ncbi:MAG: hypothetical protein OXG46_02640 [Chloroflexi bacterium]|nr:hypothetical protein [Chloroflexota bacterium]MCY3937000.1 hypothetical protein [Chloroflexota bacterium]